MPKTRYQPTDEDRRRVKTLAGLGLRQEQICVMIGLRSPKTLRRYFAQELATGIVESSINVRKTAFKLAVSKKDPAMTIFMLKTRARWYPGMNAHQEVQRDEELIFICADYEPADLEEQR